MIHITAKTKYPRDGRRTCYEKNIEKIVIHYDNGEENTIHKGFMCGIKEDTESGEATLDFTMCHISGRDLEMIVMGCLQLGERLGMFDGRKEKPE